MRKIKALIVCTLCLVTATAMAQKQEGLNNPKFDDYFTDATLRVDYMRIGCMKHDTCILKRLVLQSNKWAGSTTQLLDPIDNGEYRIMVKDSETGRELYSRTYNTLFEEYRSTIASRERDSIATFEEVMLVPMPKRKVVICLQKRDSKNVFFTSAIFKFDPMSERMEVQRNNIKPLSLKKNGDPHKKIDVVIVAEGYGKKDGNKMMKDFDKFTSYLLGQEPFKSRAEDFNVWGIGYLAEESGVTDPNANRYVKSAVGSTYNTFNMDRYLMTTNLFQLHDLIAGTPYDHIIIMANCDTYGGGAIYNYYAFSAVQEMSMWILPHELGHSIGGLADEYVEDDPNYNRRYEGIEPLEPNITSLINFESKWKDLVEEGTPIPTEPVKGLKRQENGPVGVYEGAGYLEKGCYRPCTKCMMRDYADFCPVCYRTLNRMFDLYVK